MLKRWDLLVILFFLLISGVFWIFMRATNKSGEYFVVFHKGKEIDRKALDKDNLLKYNFSKGNYVEIKIENNAVRVTRSSCPHKFCVKESWIKLGGQRIICVPNEFVLGIYPKFVANLGIEDSKEIDGVSG